jgi:hypothetical protein
LICGKGGAWGLTRRGTGLQVITSKDTEIEDLREELAETKKLEADLRESKVCVYG